MEEEEVEDDGERFLQVMKSNYGPAGGKVRVRWDKGAFVLADTPAKGMDRVELIDLQVTVLKAIEHLCRNGTRMSADKNSRTYVVNTLAQHPMTKRFSRGQIEAAKDALMGDGRLVQVELRRDGHKRWYVKPRDLVLPEEEKR